ncbi:hypothetical protein SANBI_002707 [Sanguibacter sp. 4.1]|uniref:Uncharacterized protein n=1 Tax=Sanguibacter biliveldensis TaxID=3030830 RepID=A0AAF0Z1T2_9MICO|nr:hypothetical protein [Sanguibacter sp. 4.1]WPF81413.1 hypothetical protein SANBI_002707 [Sanguibacter sp. 4.1]
MTLDQGTTRTIPDRAEITRTTPERDISPAVAGRGEITAPFLEYYDAHIAVAQPRLNQLASSSTELSGNDDQIQREAIDLFSDIGRHGEGSPTPLPFAEVENDEAIPAYADAPACETVVPATQY